MFHLCAHGFIHSFFFFNSCIQLTGSVWFFLQNVPGARFLSVPAFMLIEDSSALVLYNTRPPSTIHPWPPRCHRVGCFHSFPQAFFHTRVSLCEMLPHPQFAWQASSLSSVSMELVQGRLPPMNVLKSAPHTHSFRSCCHSVFVNYVKNFKLYLVALGKQWRILSGGDVLWCDYIVRDHSGGWGRRGWQGWQWGWPWAVRYGLAGEQAVVVLRTDTMLVVQRERSGWLGDTFWR